MVTYEMVLNDDNIISYRYYPEGGKNAGFVSVDKKNLKVLSKQLSHDDVGDWYAHHVITRIFKMIESGTFEEKGMAAWY